MKGEPVKYIYETNLKWTEAKKGILSSVGKPDIHIACPPEFGGHKNIWSPEDLFLASVEVCIMTTFLWFVKKNNISFKSYLSSSKGYVKLDNGRFRFYKIDINVKIAIDEKTDKEKIEIILKKVKRACLISNSISSEIAIFTEIVTN